MQYIINTFLSLSEIIPEYGRKKKSESTSLFKQQSILKSLAEMFKNLGKAANATLEEITSKFSQVFNIMPNEEEVKKLYTDLEKATEKYFKVFKLPQQQRASIMAKNYTSYETIRSNEINLLFKISNFVNKMIKAINQNIGNNFSSETSIAIYGALDVQKESVENVKKNYQFYLKKAINSLKEIYKFMYNEDYKY